MEKIVRGYMVKSPYMTDPGVLVQTALEMMRELEIRHLPVVQDGELVGMVSERDLREAAAINGKLPLLVGDVMKREVYVTTPQTPLSEVVRVMCLDKIGSAVVVSPDRDVVGIFTTIDALELLADMLDEEDDQALVLEEYFERWPMIAGFA